MHSLFRSFGPACSMLLLSACATTQVPQVNAAQLHHPKLSAKALRVEVRDTRTPPADDNGKTIDVVRDAIVKVLTDSGVNVTNEGREVLSVGVGYFDHPPAGFDRESCVELAGRLVVGSGPVETRSFGCYGSSKGVNEAFATALNTLFDELEKRSADAAAKAAPPSAPPSAPPK